MTLDTTVPFVMNQEFLDQKETAHAQMDNMNSNINVMIVLTNVRHMKLCRFLLTVLKREKTKLLEIAHVEHMNL